MKLITAILLPAAASAADGATCTALAVGGLGSQQNYVAGAIDALVKAGASYDVVVSSGSSLIAAEAAATGTAAAFAKGVLSATLDATAAAMYSDYPGGVEAALTQPGANLYNNSVSASTFAQILSTPVGTPTRTVVAVATSLTTTLQTPLPVTVSNIAGSVAGLVASAADPATYAAYPASFNGVPDLFVSGAVRGPVNVFEAVAQCRKLGFADADITVDVVYTSASFLLQRDVSKDTTLFVVLRDDNIKKYVAATQDVLYAKLAYTDVNFRYDVSPAFPLQTSTENYDYLNKLGMQANGRADAAAEIKRVNSQTECDSVKSAPSCTEDQDCVSWATKYCLSKTLPKQGRCLAARDDATDEDDDEDDPRPAGSCSFNATEIAEHYASRVTKKASDGTCLAAAFSGGGDRGAYEAGVVQGLADNSPAAKVAWEVSSGVSVGSLVSTGLAKFPIGEESAASVFMVDTALSVTRDVIYKNWTNLIPFIGPSGVVRGLLFESGLYDSSGERTLLTTKFSKTPLDPTKHYRTHTALATNMGTGQGTVFSYVGADGSKGLIDGLMASSAIQGAFPMQQIGKNFYGDGGAVLTIDAYSAAETCRRLGYPSSSIQIDTISVAGFNQIKLPPGLVFFLNATQIKARVDTIQLIDSLMAVIDFYRTAQPGLFRYNIFPSQQLPGTGLDFNVAQMQQMVTIGIKDGKTIALKPVEEKANALPDTCNYQTVQVDCGMDKDCFNWGVELCNSQLKSAVCAHDTRTCVFSA
jgi:predicted acylesterase/phospholipase RssA